jgi:hypothetical protein
MSLPLNRTVLGVDFVDQLKVIIAEVLVLSIPALSSWPTGLGDLGFLKTNGGKYNIFENFSPASKDFSLDALARIALMSRNI